MFNKWRPPHRQPGLIRAVRSHTHIDGMIACLSPLHTHIHTHTYVNTTHANAQNPPAATLTFGSEVGVFGCTYILSASCRGHRVQSAPWGHYWNEMEMHDAASIPEQENEQSLQFWAVMLTAPDLICPGGHCTMRFVWCGLFWINEADCESISTGWFCLGCVQQPNMYNLSLRCYSFEVPASLHPWCQPDKRLYSLNRNVVIVTEIKCFSHNILVWHAGWIISLLSWKLCHTLYLPCSPLLFWFGAGGCLDTVFL